jgi:hypothetical protein
MTKQYSIVADIAGNREALEALWVKLNPNSTKILVGDLFDRGPDSKGVWEFVRSKPDTIVLYGNHEDFLFRSLKGVVPDSYEYYEQIHWKTLWCCITNGGQATLDSFSDKSELKKVVEWVESLPVFYRDDGAGLFVSHAPLSPRSFREVNSPIFKKDVADLNSIVWGRNIPPRQPGLLQVFGHNRFKTEYSDELGLFAVCIDDCGRNRLCALEFPSMEYIYQ